MKSLKKLIDNSHAYSLREGLSRSLHDALHDALSNAIAVALSHLSLWWLRKNALTRRRR